MNGRTQFLGSIRSALPFIAIAFVGILAGGAVSAASAPAASYTSSWAVAYLVLVVGIAQLALGVTQTLLLGSEQPTTRMVAAEAATFNAANIAVLLGTLIDTTVVVDVGGALMLVSLVLFLWAVRAAHTSNRGLLWVFRFVVVVLAVTTPIGLVISAVRDH